MKRFDDKTSDEKVVATFDFSAALDAGETLTGTIAITVSTYRGTDVTPSAVLNGAASFDATSKMVIQPVKAGSSGCEYSIKAVVQTTNANKVLALTGILPVYDN